MGVFRTANNSPRMLIFVAVGAAVALVLAPLLGILAPSHVAGEGEGLGVRVKIGDERVSLQDTMDPLKRVLSGPGWLLAEGLDPRVEKRPPWDTLTRLRWRDLQGPFSGLSAPAQQAGGGLLVPFRDPAPAFSRNILITRDFSNAPVQLEPHMAMDPTDPDHLVVAAIDFNFPSNSVYTTFDGGETWEGPIQTPFLRQDLAGGGDPVVGFDREGNVFISSISIGTEEFSVGRFAVVAQVSSIAVTSSGDGGLTWSDPANSAREVPVTDLGPPDELFRVRGQILIPFLDKPWMHVGPHPDNPDLDVIYVTYTEFVNVLEVLYIDEIPAFSGVEVRTTIKLVRSEDGGKTWSEPLAVSPTVRRSAGDAPAPGGGIAVGLKRVVQGSEPRVAPDGTLYVSWMDSTDDDSQEGLAEIYVARSDDAGKSFSEAVRVTVFREPGFRPRNAFFRYWGSAFPHIAIGPEGELYIVYVGLNPAKPTDDGDVFFSRSMDRGATWTRPKRLGGDETSSLQFFPALATDPSGNLHVMWGDMRDDKAQTRYHIYYTTSQDRGDTWGFELPELNIRADDTRVTDFPSNPNKGFPNGLFIGDYFAITASDEDVYMVWADTRLGEFAGFNQKVAFARRRAIPAVEVFISPPAGPGGQEVTIQGFNLQPELNVFIQVGGVFVAAERTNAEGRFTSRLFMPVSGEGAQTVRVVDDSGNVAGTSFFTEFGFGNIRELQEVLERKVDALADGASGAGVDQLRAELQQLQALIEEEGLEGDGTAWWVIFLATLGGAILAAAAATAVTITVQSRRWGASGDSGG